MFKEKIWLLLLVIGLFVQVSCANENWAQQNGNRWDSSGKKGGNWGQNDGSNQDSRSWSKDGRQPSEAGSWDSRHTQIKDSNTWDDGRNEQPQRGNWGPNDMQTKDGGSWNSDSNQQEESGVWRPQNSQVKQDGNWNSQNWGPGDSQAKDEGKWKQPSESGRFSPNDIQVKDGSKPSQSIKPQERWNPEDGQRKDDTVWDMPANMGNTWGPRDSQEKIGGQWNPGGGQQTQNDAWSSTDTQIKDMGSWNDGGNQGGGAFGPMDTQGKIGDSWNPNDGQKKVEGEWSMDGNRPSDGNWDNGSPGGTTWGTNDGQDEQQGNVPGWTPDGMQGGGVWDQGQGQDGGGGGGGNWPSTDQGGILGPSGGGDIGSIDGDYRPTPENARGDTGVTHIPPVGTAGGVGQGNYKGGDAGSYPGDDPSQWRIEDSIPGMPGVDYPNYDAVPNTGFDCKQQENPGYYGDVDAQCQVFHICQSDGRHDSFLCPLGTIFNQQYFVCDWWFNFNCADTPTYYNLNANLYRVDPDAQGNFKGDTYGRGITEVNYAGPVGDISTTGVTNGIDYRQDDVNQNVGIVGTRPDIFSPTEASITGGGIQNIAGVGITDSIPGGYRPVGADQTRIQGAEEGRGLPGGNVDAPANFGGGQDVSVGVVGKPNTKGGRGSPSVPNKPWDSGPAVQDGSTGGSVAGQGKREGGRTKGGSFDGGKKGGSWGSNRNWGGGVKGGQVSLWEADGTTVIARQGNLWDRMEDSLAEENEKWARSDVSPDVDENPNLESTEVAQGSNFKANAVLGGEEFRDASVLTENWVHPGVNKLSKSMNTKWTVTNDEAHEVKNKISNKEKLRNSEGKLQSNVMKPNRRAQTRSWNGSISGNDRNWWKDSKIRNSNDQRSRSIVSSESSPVRENLKQNITIEPSSNSSTYFNQNPKGRKRSRPRGRKSNGYNGTWKLLS